MTTTVRLYFSFQTTVSMCHRLIDIILCFHKDVILPFDFILEVSVVFLYYFTLILTKAENIDKIIKDEPAEHIKIRVSEKETKNENKEQ